MSIIEQDGDDMKSILVELECRQCMYHTYRKSETLILSDFETQVKEQLLNDTFFTMQCPRCHTKIEYIHPLAYIDKKHAFILLIKAKKDFSAKDHHLYADDTHSKKRFLCDHTKIAEKMRILEDDLDDRCIEILKVKLHLQFKKRQRKITHMEYHDKDRNSQTLWFETNGEYGKDMFAVSLKDYERIACRLQAEHHDRYLEIDETWACEWLKHH